MPRVSPEGFEVGAGRFVVRVLNGPHEGAEMEIPRDGVTIGSGEECDLILFDTQVVPRHAQLTLGGQRVVLCPLQGAVWLDMVSIKDKVELLDGAKQIITVGNTHLAVGSLLPGEGEAWWPAAGLSGGLPSGEESASSMVVQTAFPTEKSRRRNALLFIAVVGALLIFTTLEMSKHLGREKVARVQEMDRPVFLGTVTPKSMPGHSGSVVVPHLPIPKPIDPSLFPLEAKVATQLSNEGVVFSWKIQGSKPQLRIWARGGAESAVARRIISRFSPPLHYHIFDLSQVEASAAMLAQLSGLSLRVRIEPEGVAFWSGYLQHEKMWHDFFLHIVRELPLIQNHRCKIVFGNQLVKILQKELRQHGLKVQPVASTGSVLLVGSLPKEQKEEWDSWMTKAYERYASRVSLIDRVNSSIVAGVASKDFFPSRIVGVAGAEGPWVTLADGSKFFQGAKLKDGHVLEEITSSMLLLSGPEGALELHLSTLD
ncbi:hypothetical protein AMD24_00232 [Candidatus Xiphinematobacter sp. Idaho Grape]|uniref:FHA domain-containing protein n=1 Tax=Candidatus Xiphinematobacter sp. Idaho Grape TaxID=1704307 RepID=UPI00070596E0|nr:FHA domain-containing protein [Candidatus Xiphinematobacter sp. Idaho Grape]ALJ56420.1 hypothetical protein AMD24_00232 [Candidatus Xiphinematobacter sp. Idaho Grape]